MTQAAGAGAAGAGADNGAGAGAGGTAPGAGAPGGGSGAGQQPQLGGADNGAAQIYRPQGLAEHLLGQDDRGTIDKLMTAYTGARDAIARNTPMVPKAEEYTFDWPESVKGLVPADDPAVGVFRELASKFKLTQEQAALVPEFLGAAMEKGWIEKPFDSGALLETLAPPSFRGTPAEKQAKGAERLTAAENFIKQLAPNHGFDDDMKQELRLLTTSGAGVRIVELLMKSGMNSSFSPGGDGAGAGGVTKAQLDARVADPRNNSQGPKFDPAFAEETRNLFKQMYPS